MQILISNPTSVRITIPEGYNIKQIAQLLYEKKLIKSTDEFIDLTNKLKFDYLFLDEIKRNENKLEGYLFPDTYEFDKKITEKEIIQRMLDNFNEKFIPIFYKKSKELKMTVDQIITLASIIEREAKINSDRKIVSSVFYNRLNNKNKSLKLLQSCATIQYIIFNKEGKVKDKLTEKDTKIDNLYNTYLYQGLPPGPIASPGILSIEAALYPENTNYLYFVAKGDGSHAFSKTLNEHNAAKNKYGVN